MTLTIDTSALAALPSVSLAWDERAAVANDRSGLAGETPLAVARPRSVAEVQDVLRVTHALHIPVVPRGAGTGLAGGATARENAIVLDLSGLDRILRIDPQTRLAVVEPGVLTAELDREAARHGLRYAPDPASAAISTVGGNIATNAGGLRCVKHGVTRDAVRGLDVVLADGTLIRTGGPTVKSSVGYDLTRLFVGSEGTLGVIVGATVALKPLPSATATLSATFVSVHEAARAVLDVLATGVEPAVLELVDAPTLARIYDHLGLCAAPGGAQLMIQTEGRAADVEAAEIAEALRQHTDDVDVTFDQDESERLLAIRRAALPAIEPLGTPFIEDIAVPVTRLAEAIERIHVVARVHDAQIFTFAHAGDGNIHPIIVAREPHDAAAVQKAADAIFALALDLGGTVSGEHGVGVLKRAWAAREIDPGAQRIEAAIKAVLDPSGLLNPGKALAADSSASDTHAQSHAQSPAKENTP